MYAIIENGIVINVVVWDGNTETWTPPAGTEAIALPSGSAIGIGWSYNGATFAGPVAQES